MKHKSDGIINCNRHALYSHQRIGSETEGLGYKRMSGNHPNNSIVEIGQNTEKSPADFRTLAVI